MATSAVSSFGSLLKVGDGNGGSEAFTTVGEVQAIKLAGIKRTVQKVTAHDTGPWEQKIVTLIDGGQVTFDINFNNLTTQGFSGGLYNDMINGTKRNFQLLIPTTVNKTASITAFVTDWAMDLPVDGVVKATLSLEITGQPTWA
jgi:hypothetical protein